MALGPPTKLLGLPGLNIHLTVWEGISNLVAKILTEIVLKPGFFQTEGLALY